MNSIRRIVLMLAVVSVFCSPAWATDLTIPTTYAVNGQVTSTNLNGNFQAVAAKINGGLDNENADTSSGYRFFETRSSLPAVGSQGRVVFLTTDNSLNFDTGSAWAKVPTGGNLMPSGSVFFMVTGSCPTGTTDVSATYSNKFIRINATGGTTGGTDTHTHSAGTFASPAHTHGGATGGVSFGGGGSQTAGALDTTHTHSIATEAATTISGTSAAGDNVPAYLTARACQVD